MRFEDLAVDPERRFALGVEADSGRHYLSIPVANGLADYEEYYAIDRAAFEHYRADPAAAAQFVDRCRRRAADELLMIAPGRDRGVPT